MSEALPPFPISNPHHDAPAAAPNPATPSRLNGSATLSDDQTSPPGPFHPAVTSFQTNTIAPSPPHQSAHGDGAAANTASTPDDSPSGPASLRISTNVQSGGPVPSQLDPSTLSPRPQRLDRKASASSLKPVTRTPSLKAALANSILSGSTPGSAFSSAFPSPVISAMGDMTPLPSPLLSADSPGPWKTLIAASGSPSQARERTQGPGEGSVLVTSSGESIDAALFSASKRRLYASLEPGENAPPSGPHGQETQHSRNRSLSEYVPDSVPVPKRNVTVSGSHSKIDPQAEESHMKREANLSESRGLTPTVEQPPTPPPSESSKDSIDLSARPKGPGSEYFEARGRHDQKRRRWRALKVLGQGTFSRVMLATSQTAPDDNSREYYSDLILPVAVNGGVDRKKLVAIKVCEHGPRGGASEDRVEMSLKRELEIMLSTHHPSLVDLKAWSIEATRAILVLNYSPGGDLFDLAATHRNTLTPPLLRRIFAELVGAVMYLHQQRIVHRDIKLESRFPIQSLKCQRQQTNIRSNSDVLVNLLPEELAHPGTDWTTYPYSVITLTDLGLSRRIADDEKLETRCGSDDYAAPEVIMGQPYDGRSTDAWSLAALLFAILEGRLPFDPHPGMSDTHRMRSRTSHRIARVEWRWIDYAGEDGDHEGSEALFREKGLLGAMEITEGLLKRARSRWTMDKVAAHPWVRDAIQVDGGLHFREEDHGEEVA